MKTRLISREEIDPLMEGLAILGTGGGGTPEWGRVLLEHDLAAGRRHYLIGPAEVEDEATIVTGGYMGSVKVLETVSMSEVIGGWEKRFELLEATRIMERLLGRTVNYVVPFEVGGLNTSVVMSLCARLGIPMINGDGLGRSAPETQMSSFIGHGIALTPMPLVDRVGNVVIVDRIREPAYADELGRWVVTHGGGMGANTLYPMSGRQLKESVIPNTVSLAIDLGRDLLSARRAGADPVEAVHKRLGGWQLLSGAIVEMEGEDRFGHYYTTARVAGQGRWSGHEARLIIKNEAMLCYLDGKEAAIFPDLVCMLDVESGRGLMSVELKVGTRLSILGVPCHPRLRAAAASEMGKRSFSAERFGHPEVAYRPIEELVQALGAALPLA